MDLMIINHILIIKSHLHIMLQLPPIELLIIILYVFHRHELSVNLCL